MAIFIVCHTSDRNFEFIRILCNDITLCLFVPGSSERLSSQNNYGYKYICVSTCYIGCTRLFEEFTLALRSMLLTQQVGISTNVKVVF